MKTACSKAPEYLYEEESKLFVREPAIPASTACGESPAEHAPGIIALCEGCAKRRGLLW